MKTALYESAVDRIRDEMAATKDAAIQAVGEIMTEQLRAQPQISEFVQKKGKTLRGAYQAISDYASKHRTGNRAVVPPAKAMELIAAYYGFTPNENPQAPAVMAAGKPTTSTATEGRGGPLPRGSGTHECGSLSAPVGRATFDDELDLDKLLES